MAGRLGAAIRTCWVCRVCGGAVPVVADAGYRIAEHGVRRLDLLEGVAVGVSAVHVGVETASQGTEGVIELVVADGRVDTEHGVQIGLTLTVLTLIGHYRFLNLVGQRCGHPVARGSVRPGGLATSRFRGRRFPETYNGRPQRRRLNSFGSSTSTRPEGW